MGILSGLKKLFGGAEETTEKAANEVKDATQEKSGGIMDKVKDLAEDIKG
jgi:uncharacterized protein YoxC